MLEGGVSLGEWPGQGFGNDIGRIIAPVAGVHPFSTCQTQKNSDSVHRNLPCSANSHDMVECETV